MSNSVFANGRELACKKASGKSLCAFPDVCLTPPDKVPPTPIGVPVPYPNTAFAKDTAKGSKKVQIGGKEVMLKNRSHFKTSTGDEAGAAQKKGILTSRNKGKAYFTMWSMNVKIEGENGVRHLDMTTHNHGSQPFNGAATLYADRMAAADIPGCEKQRGEVETACGKNGENFSCPDRTPLTDAKRARDTASTRFGKNSPQHLAAKHDVDTAIDGLVVENRADECRRKMRCLLSPYSPSRCCPGQTPHHLVEAGSFYDTGRGGKTKKAIHRAVFERDMFKDVRITKVKVGEGDVWSRPVFGAEGYDQKAAPCVCCEGESQHQGTHRLLHQAQGEKADSVAGVPNPNPFFTLTTSKGETAKMQKLSSAIDGGVEAVEEVFPESACDPACTRAQLEDHHYEQAGMNPELPILAVDGNGKAIPA